MSLFGQLGQPQRDLPHPFPHRFPHRFPIDSPTACKGARICEAGRCVEPSAPAPAEQPTAPAAAPPLDASHEIRAARSAAVGGWVLTGLTGVAGAGAAALSASGADWEASVGTGGLALVSCAVGVPVASMHGARLRREVLRRGGDIHSPGLRIASWVLYGFTMAQGSTLVALGVSEEVPVPLILGTVVTGMTANILMNVDTWKTAAAAERLSQQDVVGTRQARVVVAPSLSIGQGGASVGLSGRF